MQIKNLVLSMWVFLICTVCLFPLQTRPSWKRPVFCRLQLWKAAGQRWMSRSCPLRPPNVASNAKPRTQNPPCLSVQMRPFVVQSLYTETEASHLFPCLISPHIWCSDSNNSILITLLSLSSLSTPLTTLYLCIFFLLDGSFGPATRATAASGVQSL